MYLADTAEGAILRCRVDHVSGHLSGTPETSTRLRDAEG
ncbi:hypothetical protein QF034_007581 [Streptomyces africanus]|uniref:Uncharacterized protein n=1 Tax=Streptomyces africanus TaxID=231024 RepID=A0ABU0R116_9ACTN|nr:hypothetical protein [Streptomyces africanus]MDQ0753350.1 hypothetical protein [Streptomyces africanus]